MLLKRSKRRRLSVSQRFAVWSTLVACVVGGVVWLKPKFYFMNYSVPGAVAWYLEAVVIGSESQPSGTLRLRYYQSGLDIYVWLPFHPHGTYEINRNDRLFQWQPVVVE